MNDDNTLFYILNNYLNSKMTFKEFKKDFLDLYNSKQLDINVINENYDSLLTYTIKHLDIQKSNLLIGFLITFPDININYYHPDNKNKDSLLHLTIKNNLTQASLDLINHFTKNEEQAKLFLNITNTEQETPIHCAIIHNVNLKIIQKLVELECNINTHNVKGETPLITSVKNNKLKLIQELLKHPDLNINYQSILNQNLIDDINPLNRVNCTPAIYALENNNKDILNFLLSKGADLLLSSLLEDLEDDNNNLLNPSLIKEANLYLSKIINNHSQLKKYQPLIGKNRNYMNNQLYNDLQRAILVYLDKRAEKYKKNSYIVIKLMLERNSIYINKYNKGTNSPILMAVENESLELTQLLIQHGANLQEIYQEEYKYGLLHIPIVKKNFKLFELLFIPSLQQNNNPKFEMVLFQSIKMIFNYLISYNPNITDPELLISELTFKNFDKIILKYPTLKPLIEQIQTRYDHFINNVYDKEDILKLFKGNEHLINDRNEYQETLLHQLIKVHDIQNNNYQDIIWELLKMGADLKLLNNQGQSAIDLIIMKQDMNLWKICVDHLKETESTILHKYCTDFTNSLTINSLIESNMFFDVQDSDGNTPIHLILNSNVNFYKFKLLSKINFLPNPEDYLNIKNKKGETSFDIINCQPDLIEIIKKEYNDIYHVYQKQFIQLKVECEKISTPITKPKNSCTTEELTKIDVESKSPKEFLLQFIKERKSKRSNIEELKQIIQQSRSEDDVLDHEIVTQILSSKKTGFIKLLINEFKFDLNEEQLKIIINIHDIDIISMFLIHSNNQYQNQLLDIISKSNKTQILESLQKKGLLTRINDTKHDSVGTENNFESMVDLVTEKESDLTFTSDYHDAIFTISNNEKEVEPMTEINPEEMRELMTALDQGNIRDLKKLLYRDLINFHSNLLETLYLLVDQKIDHFFIEVTQNPNNTNLDKNTKQFSDNINRLVKIVKIVKQKLDMKFVEMLQNSIIDDYDKTLIIAIFNIDNLVFQKNLLFNNLKMHTLYKINDNNHIELLHVQQSLFEIMQYEEENILQNDNSNAFLEINQKYLEY